MVGPRSGRDTHLVAVLEAARVAAFENVVDLWVAGAAQGDRQLIGYAARLPGLQGDWHAENHRLVTVLSTRRDIDIAAQLCPLRN